MRRLSSLSLALLLFAGCKGNSAVEFDAASDFAVPRQLSQVGKSGVTCCLTTSGAKFAMYLLDPQPGEVDSRGIQRPARGELHITNAFGADYTLGSDVPVFGYAFSPDGRFAMFTSKVKTYYALNFAALTTPEFKQPPVTAVVPDGLQDYQLFQQAFFSATGRYLIVGVLPPKVDNSPELHVIDMTTATDVYALGNGAFNYIELVAPDDTMVFENSTASTVPGVPSVQGLYYISLPVAIAAKAPPALIDTHVGPVDLMGDGTSVIYIRQDASLMYYDLHQKFQVKLAANVASFTLGPDRRGPIVWVGRDGSFHVTPKLGAELYALPAGSADLFTTVRFSPDSKRIYFFKKLSSQDHTGEMWVVHLRDNSLTPFGGVRVSTRDLTFIGDRLLTIQSVDGRGDAGDMVSSLWDGSDRVVIAKGAQLGSLQVTRPEPRPTTQDTTPFFGKPDLLPPSLPPIFAGLTATTRDSGNTPIDESPALLGTLTLSSELKALGRPVGSGVHAGTFTFSDDGYVLALVKDAMWNDTAVNYVGRLDLIPTKYDIGAPLPALDGVSELGPMVERQMFVTAPGNPKPGVYFLKY